METPKVFISFSSRDKTFVRKLFYSLKSQGIDVWDYSQRGEEIPLANPVSDHLEKQINASDYFIALASSNSTDEKIGHFTHHEVKTAILRGMLSGGRILPIVLLTHPPKNWQGAYKRLEDLNHLEIDPSQPKQYEEGIEKICRYLGVRYVPPFIGDLRLPFSEKFVKEIKDMNLPIALYGELMLIIDDFTKRFSNGDWLESERLISYFLMLSHYKLPGVEFYYPQIIKGVCELQMGRFLEAEETFLQATKHSHADENSYGGLGQVYFRQQRYAEALTAYKEAHKICPKNKDLEVRFNILAAQVQMGIEVDDKKLLDQFDLSDRMPEDWIKIMNLKGILYFKTADYDAALGVFESMRRQNLYDSTSVTYHGLTLRKQGKSNEAIELLRHESERLDDTNLYHHLADACLASGMMDEALNVYGNKLCQNQRMTRQYLVEYARILKATGNTRVLREICEKVLSQKYFKNPTSDEDFYYDGFANYLLGNHERARYDYERSSSIFEKYYNEL